MTMLLGHRFLRGTGRAAPMADVSSGRRSGGFHGDVAGDVAASP